MEEFINCPESRCCPTTICFVKGDEVAGTPGQRNRPVFSNPNPRRRFVLPAIGRINGRKISRYFLRTLWSCPQPSRRADPDQGPRRRERKSHVFDRGLSRNQREKKAALRFRADKFGWKQCQGFPGPHCLISLQSLSKTRLRHLNWLRNFFGKGKVILVFWPATPTVAAVPSSGKDACGDCGKQVVLSAAARECRSRRSFSRQSSSGSP